MVRNNAPSKEAVHEAIACLQRLAEAFHARRLQLAATAGVTDHQWGVLEEIATEHFMPSMFARRRRSTAAAVSKTLRQLVDKGLVGASVDRQDARQRQYVLTARGRRVMEKLRASRQAAIDHIWADLDGPALVDFTRFGGELTRRMDAYAGQGGQNKSAASRSGGRPNARTQEKKNGKNTVRQGL